jgi:hypothetical protein
MLATVTLAAKPEQRRKCRGPQLPMASCPKLGSWRGRGVFHQVDILRHMQDTHAELGVSACSHYLFLTAYLSHRAVLIVLHFAAVQLGHDRHRLHRVREFDGPMT